MEPTSQESAPKDERISAEQLRIDKLDAKADRKVDLDQEQERLTQTYIDRVNDVQGQIRRVRRMVEVKKDAKSPEWQKIEENCTGVAQELLRSLTAVDRDNAVAKVTEFNQKIERFLGQIGKMQKGAEHATETDEMLRRRVSADVELIRMLPESVREILFPAFEEQFIWDLLENDRLEDSPYADCASAVRSVLESAHDRAEINAAEVSALRAQEQNNVQELIEMTKNSEYNFSDLFTNKIDVLDKTAATRVTIIKKLRDQMKEKQQSRQPLDQLIVQLDTALAFHDSTVAHATGNTEEGNRLLLKLREVHGEQLKDVIPKEIWVRIEQATTTLRTQGKLTRFEDAYFSGHTQEAIQAAIDEQRKIDSSADILDQFRMRQTFVIRSMQDAASHWKLYPAGSGSIPRYQGRSQNHLKDCSIATLDFRQGEGKTIMLTPQAKEKIMKLPKGAQPLLLKPVLSMQTKFVGSGRGAFQAFTDAPSTFLLQETDIGYVLNGATYRSDGNRLDTTAHENGAELDLQTQTQRSFGIADYRSPVTLRRGEKEHYPHRLFTIRMQSGAMCEGVTIGSDALKLIEQPPPKGFTLVLRRTPKSVALSTVYAESVQSGQSGRGSSKTFRRVLDADLITVGDLAYAKTEGKSLITRSVTAETEQNENIGVIEKNRTEHSRDLLRILGNDPSMVYAKRTAATFEQGTATLQRIMQAKNEGSAQESFVRFAQGEAMQMIDLIQNSETLEHVRKAKAQLSALKRADLGIALGPIEQEIDTQIKALDSFIAMLESPQTLDLLKTITDKSKFAPDTWANWWANEFPRIAAALIVAVAAAAAVTAASIASGGVLAIPFVMGLTSAAAGAAGGMLGAELAAEAIYYGHRRFDSDLQQGMKFTARSRAGRWAQAWMEKEKVFNPETGKAEELTFLKDVLSPYAKEFAFSFATTYITIGIGNFGATQLSRLLQRTHVMERIAAKSDILKIATRLLTRMNTNEGLKRAGNFKQFLKQTVKQVGKELPDEAGDELVENGLEKFLNNLCTGIAVIEGVNGTVGWGNVAAALVMICKGTKIGSSTRAFPVQSKADIPARAQQIKLDLEQKGALVTDLGKGYLSVEYPVLTDDGKPTGKWEKAQLMPEVESERTQSKDKKEGTDDAERKKQDDQQRREEHASDIAHSDVPPELRVDPEEGRIVVGFANFASSKIEAAAALLIKDLEQGTPRKSWHEYLAAVGWDSDGPKCYKVPFQPGSEEVMIKFRTMAGINAKMQAPYIFLNEKSIKNSEDPAEIKAEIEKMILALHHEAEHICHKPKESDTDTVEETLAYLSDSAEMRAHARQSAALYERRFPGQPFDIQKMREAIATLAPAIGAGLDNYWNKMASPEKQQLYADSGYDLATVHRQVAELTQQFLEQYQRSSQGTTSDSKKEAGTGSQVPLETLDKSDFQKIKELGFNSYDAARRAIEISKITEEEFSRTGKIPDVEGGTEGFVRNCLTRAGTGEPGLSVLENVALNKGMNVTRIVYRDAKGNAVSVAEVYIRFDLLAQKMKTEVVNFATDKSKGILGARAAVEVGKKLVEMGALSESSSISPDAKRLLHNFMTKQVKKIPPEIRDALERGVQSKYALFQLAKEARTRGKPELLKQYLTQHDVSYDVRIEIAENLLGRPLSESVKSALQQAHAMPGAIDEGNMAMNIPKLGTVYDAIRLELKSQGMPEQQAHQQAMRESKLLLDAGLAGMPATVRERSTAPARTTEESPSGKPRLAQILEGSVNTRTARLIAYLAEPATTGDCAKRVRDAATHPDFGPDFTAGVLWSASEDGKFPGKELENVVRNLGELAEDTTAVRRAIRKRFQEGCKPLPETLFTDLRPIAPSSTPVKPATEKPVTSPSKEPPKPYAGKFPERSPTALKDLVSPERADKETGPIPIAGQVLSHQGRSYIFLGEDPVDHSWEFMEIKTGIQFTRSREGGKQLIGQCTEGAVEPSVLARLGQPEALKLFLKSNNTTPEQRKALTHQLVSTLEKRLTTQELDRIADVVEQAHIRFPTIIDGGNRSANMRKARLIYTEVLSILEAKGMKPTEAKALADRLTRAPLDAGLAGWSQKLLTWLTGEQQQPSAPRQAPPPPPPPPRTPRPKPIEANPAQPTAPKSAPPPPPPPPRTPKPKPAVAQPLQPGSSKEATSKPLSSNRLPQQSPELVRDTKLFHDFSLLSAFRTRSYDEIRQRLSQLSFSDLASLEKSYNRKVAELEQDYRRAHPQEHSPTFKSADEVREYIFRDLQKQSTIVNGRLAAKNVSDASEGGYPVEYGTGATGERVTTFWINPHIERVGDTMRILDQCLKGCNASIKVHLRPFDDLAHDPQARGNDKIVVYFTGEDHAGMSQFLKQLSAAQPQWQTWMMPESLKGIIYNARIPLAPGLSFAERPNTNSWDTQMTSLWKHGVTAATQLSQWMFGKAELRPVDLRHWLTPNQSRVQTMPGLINHPPESPRPIAAQSPLPPNEKAKPTVQEATPQPSSLPKQTPTPPAPRKQPSKLEDGGSEHNASPKPPHLESKDAIFKISQGNELFQDERGEWGVRIGIHMKTQERILRPIREYESDIANGSCSEEHLMSLHNAKEQLFAMLSRGGTYPKDLPKKITMLVSQYYNTLRPLPEHRNRPTPEHAKTQEQLQSFHLIDSLKSRSYAQVREELSTMDYCELLAFQERYDAEVASMERQHRSAYPACTPLPTMDLQQLNEHMFRVLSEPKTLQHGRLDAKNSHETENGGFIVHFNKGLTSSESVPKTVFYINPFLENMPEAMKLLDAALAKQNAQVKVYTDDMSDIEKPSARPSNKIVVYFEGNDQQGITEFLRFTSDHAQEWRTILKPEHFSKVMTTFRIPLIPGFTLIERGNGRSWDTTYIGQFLGGDQRLRPMIDRWEKEGKKPTPEEWASNVRPLSSRNRTIPGLLGDAP